MAAEWSTRCGWARWKAGRCRRKNPAFPHCRSRTNWWPCPPLGLSFPLVRRGSLGPSPAPAAHPPAAAPAPGGASSMTRRSAGQAPARRPLDWSGRGGPERRRPAPLRSRERKRRAAPGWAGGPGHLQVLAGAGGGGQGPGLQAGVGPLSAAPAQLRTWGRGPPAGSEPLGARGARRPALPPPELLRGPRGVRAPDGPEPAAFSGTPASQPPRAPQGQTGLGLPELPGTPASSSWESEPPPDPAPFPGSR